jgi:hypothetical protein
MNQEISEAKHLDQKVLLQKAQNDVEFLYKEFSQINQTLEN